MTKLSPKFYELLDRNPHFSELPNDHPDVIAVQEQAEMELLAMGRVENMRRELELKEFIQSIDRDKFTTDMYCYLAEQGLTNLEISQHVRATPALLNEWKAAKKIHTTDIHQFVITDIETETVINTFKHLKEAARFLDVGDHRIYMSARSGLLIDKRYRVDKELTRDVSREEAMIVVEEETYQYWLKNRKKVGVTV